MEAEVSILTSPGWPRWWRPGQGQGEVGGEGCKDRGEVGGLTLALCLHLFVFIFFLFLFGF